MSFLTNILYQKVVLEGRGFRPKFSVKKLKDPDDFAVRSNPMTYIDRVKPPRRVRFLVGDGDRLVSKADALVCATQFPDGACYVVPGLGHGQSYYGPLFTDHVRYFLVTQLGDWRD